MPQSQSDCLSPGKGRIDPVDIDELQQKRRASRGDARLFDVWLPCKRGRCYQRMEAAASSTVS